MGFILSNKETPWFYPATREGGSTSEKVLRDGKPSHWTHCLSGELRGETFYVDFYPPEAPTETVQWCYDRWVGKTPGGEDIYLDGDTVHVEGNSESPFRFPSPGEAEEFAKILQ